MQLTARSSAPEAGAPSPTKPPEAALDALALTDSDKADKAALIDKVLAAGPILECIIHDFDIQTLMVLTNVTPALREGVCERLTDRRSEVTYADLLWAAKWGYSAALEFMYASYILYGGEEDDIDHECVVCTTLENGSPATAVRVLRIINNIFFEGVDDRIVRYIARMFIQSVSKSGSKPACRIFLAGLGRCRTVDLSLTIVPLSIRDAILSMSQGPDMKPFELCMESIDASLRREIFQDAGVSGKTPLHLAAGTAALLCINTLLEAGADTRALCDVNAADAQAQRWAEENPDNVRFTPIVGPSQVEAHEFGHAVRRLGEAMKADGHGEMFLNSRWDALKAAVVGKSPYVVKALLEVGASVDARDDDGAGPLHWAACAGVPEIVEMLLEAGADPNSLDNAGRTPADLVPQKSRPAMRRLLGADDK